MFWFSTIYVLVLTKNHKFILYIFTCSLLLNTLKVTILIMTYCSIYVRLVYTVQYKYVQYLLFTLTRRPTSSSSFPEPPFPSPLQRTTIYLAGHQSCPFPSCICPCHHCFARVQYHEAVLDCNR